MVLDEVPNGVLLSYKINQFFIFWCFDILDSSPCRVNYFLEIASSFPENVPIVFTLLNSEPQLLPQSSSYTLGPLPQLLLPQDQLLDNYG